MRQAFLPLLITLLAVALSLAGDEQPKSGLKPGDDLPGPFRPYNVTGRHGERVVKDLGGKEKEVEGQFHCLVCDNGLSPVAMVIARNVNLDKPPEALVELLKQLNVAIQKNRRTRLSSFAVFLSDDLPDVITDNEKRQELAGKLKDIDKQAELNRGEYLPLALESKKYLAHYPLDENTPLTVVLYNQHKVVATLPFAADKLADDEGKKTVEAILAKVKEMVTGK